MSPKLTLDEEAFQKLLSAAYVLQRQRQRQTRHQTLLTQDRAAPETQEPAAEPAPAAVETPKRVSAPEEIKASETGIEKPPEAVIETPTAPSPEVVPAATFAAPFEAVVRGVAAPPLESDEGRRLSTIAETQHWIVSRNLDVRGAMELVAERMLPLLEASGAAVFERENNVLVCRAASGEAGFRRDERVSLEGSPFDVCLQSSEVARGMVSVSGAGPGGAEVLHRVAVPIHHLGAVAGVVDILRTRPMSEDRDVRTCQLMAGLLSEAMARQSETEWKKTLVEERATLLATLEKIKPQLEMLAGQNAETPVERSRKKASTRGRGKDPQAVVAQTSSEPTSSGLTNLGAFLLEQQARQEKTPATVAPAERAPDATDPGWEMLKSAEGKEFVLPEAMTHPDSDSAGAYRRTGGEWEVPDWTSEGAGAGTKTSVGPQEENDDDGWQPPSLPARVLPGMELYGPKAKILASGGPAESQEAEVEPATTMALEPVSPWTSAVRAREWLEKERAVIGNKPWQFLRERWADVMVGAAAALLLAAIAWAVWAQPSGTAALRARIAKQPKLTFVEKVMVSLGMAEPPEAPAGRALGNPAVQVWVDTHTALYYCPGADLYGKTKNGRLLKQADAQQEQFEPALRQPCE